MNLKGFLQTNPLRRTAPWNIRTSYLIVDGAIFLIWAARILSPGSWWGAIFSYKARDGRYYPKATPMEVYLILVFAFGVVAGITDLLRGIPGVVAVIAVLLIIEITMYHFWIMLVRPRIDPNYIQYSGIRTVILTSLAFLNIVNLYSALYLHAFRANFEPELLPWLAWAYSAGEITGSGYSGVRADTTRFLALTAGSEKLLGVLFLAFIVSLAVSKVQATEIGKRLGDYKEDVGKEDPKIDVEAVESVESTRVEGQSSDGRSELNDKE